MASVDSIPSGGITLQDNENSVDERNNACWARSVEVTDHVVVNGSATNIGAFAVWNIRVQTLNVSGQLPPRARDGTLTIPMAGPTADQTVSYRAAS